jgi:geranylgeranyl transferase type-2 subunit alpha
MLAIDGRNFHGWGYRRIVVEKIELISSIKDPTTTTTTATTETSTTAAGSTSSSLAQSEFDYTTKMISSNLSNFSAWHARSRILPRLLSEQNASPTARIAAYDAESALLTRALYTDPYDQSLWTYHQFLMTALNVPTAPSPSVSVSVTQSIDEDSGVGILGDAADLDEGLRKKYLRAEGEKLREMVEGAEDCKYIYQALLENGRRSLMMNRGEAIGEGGMHGEEDEMKRMKEEMRGWLGQLRTLDPLRKGRWEDLGRKLGLL